MSYAVQRLRPVMPRALGAGLGRRQVMKIRSLDRVVRALWLERTMDTEAEYDEAFNRMQDYAEQHQVLDLWSQVSDASKRYSSATGKSELASLDESRRRSFPRATPRK